MVLRFLGLFCAFILLLSQESPGEEFTYGLWGNMPSPVPQTEEQSRPPKREKREKKKNDLWKAFLPKDVPAPIVKLLENPTPENVKKYWRAYEEYTSRLAKAESLIRAMQVQYARKVSKEYELYYLFSPTCPACRRYTPLLFEGLWKEGFNLPVKAFVVGNLELGRAMMAGVGVSQVLSATPRLISELGLENAGLPTAVLLTPQGEVVGVWEGSRVLELLNFLKEKRDEEMAGNSNSSGSK